MAISTKNLIGLARILAFFSAIVATAALVFRDSFPMLALALTVFAAMVDAALLAVAAGELEKVPEGDCETGGIDGIAQEYGLSPREVDVLEAYARNRDIGASASELFISQGTVKSHLSHIYAKVGVSCCNELLRLCDSRSAKAA